jgi:hypothetical protein
MERKLLGRVAVAALSATLGLATPAEAFRGGMGGMGGGFHGGGFHGGMVGGFHGGMVGGRGMMAPAGRPFIGGFHGGMVGGRGIVGPVGHRFGPAHFAFRHNGHFRRAVFVGVGAPYFYGGYYGDSCWQQVWTSWGWRWVNYCYGY